MRILITWGSKRGGTEGIARIVGEVLQKQGFEVTMEPASRVRDVRAYDAAVVGGALYANRWHRDAGRFVSRHIAALRGIPVWLFSTGPLDDSADRREIPPTTQVAVLMERLGARGHVTFGGCLPIDAKGFPASAMAKKLTGDWRNPDRIRAWASELGRELPAARPGVAIRAPGAVAAARVRPCCRRMGGVRGGACRSLPGHLDGCRRRAPCHFGALDLHRHRASLLPSTWRARPVSHRAHIHCHRRRPGCRDRRRPGPAERRHVLEHRRNLAAARLDLPGYVDHRIVDLHHAVAQDREHRGRAAQRARPTGRPRSARRRCERLKSAKASGYAPRVPPPASGDAGRILRLAVACRG